MTQQNDLALSKFTAKLLDTETLNTIGSGILYTAKNLKDKIYLLTAAHNLYRDGDSFLEPLNRVNIDIYQETSNSYTTIVHSINYDLVCPDKDKDVAVLILEKTQIESITGILFNIQAVKERHSITSFVLKGFPNAGLGQELACIHPVWTQAMTGVNKFQLQLTEDYTSWATGGFSGSGVFLHTSNQIYLYGIFTRFRAEGKGKVIYCQYLETLNEILNNNYLPLITFSYLGEHGINDSFFSTHTKNAINNLGPRFNEELNFRLPIAQLFSDIAKDNIFKTRLSNIIDRWLTKTNPSNNSNKTIILTDIEADLVSLRDAVAVWISQINWRPDQQIDVKEIYQQVELFNQKLDKKQSELYELQWKEKETDIEKKKDFKYRVPYDNEIKRIGDILDKNYDILNDLNNINISLSNFPCLIVQGEAGCGKSHLLGDIAYENNKNRIPTILLLGQLFRSGQTVWQNILSQLNLTCSKEEFLATLNSIGSQTGARVLILIDALNEGAGKELWPNELPGFIADINRYSFIGLVLTIRNTYYNRIIPSSIQSNNEIIRVVHEGFKGNEYEALLLFCDHYQLQQPNFPLLTPEFTNPLFLQLVCQGVKETEKKIFPQGFQGISNIFGYYLKAIGNKLCIKREEYCLRRTLTLNAIHVMAKACFEEDGIRTLSLEKAIDLFDTKFPNHKHLLDDLIHENVFIQSLVYDNKTETEIEVVYFAYERFGDFFIADELLQLFTTQESIKAVFQKEQSLGKLLEDPFWKNRGILEALAVLLPEKYALEICEVYDWAFEKNDESHLGNITSWLNQYLLDSLKWRKTESIDNEKLTAWINSEKFNLGQDYLFNTIVQLTALKDHPFNSDRLYRNLIKHTMPERDSFWQQYLRYYAEKDDSGDAYPLKRLIDWGWLPQLSGKIDTETARLTGQTLSWVLSSTNRSLRDQATKAMVNLLEEQTDALILILKAFRNINEPYILERLYAVAYGCVLRTSKNAALKKIAQYVFDTVFKEGSPPIHILLRDYTRNIVEYALYKQLSIEGNMSLIKPPYNSPMPSNIYTEEQINNLKKSHEAPDYQEKYGHYNNQINHSVRNWDFGRYTIDSALKDFNPVSFRTEMEYKNFLTTLKGKQRQAIKFYYMTLEAKIVSEHEKEAPIKNIDNHIAKRQELLKAELTPDQYEFFVDEIIPHFINVQRTKDRQRNFYDTEPIKRWIVQRVFELGYNAELHGRYESDIEGFSNSSKNKIERIGKKYQWIAFHEAVAMIADNHMIKESWSENRKYEYYKGAWQEYLRDIDPAFLAKNHKNVNDDAADEVEFKTNLSNWWMDTPYNYWNSGPAWVTSNQDLPDARHIIQRTDESGNHWLYLRTNITWDEPKTMGQDKYRSKRKDIWYLIQGYVIQKKGKAKIIRWFQQQSFRGRWLPGSHKANLSLINRENYWSLASLENDDEKWVKIKDAPYKIMVATSEAVGEFSNDKSGAHFMYDMPCKLIFEGMKLQYAPNDGEFKNELGEIVVTHIKNGGILISKKHFFQFLNENNLDIIWTLLGEKRNIGDSHTNREHNYTTTLSGVYFLEKEVLTGNLSLSNDEG